MWFYMSLCGCSTHSSGIGYFNHLACGTTYCKQDAVIKIPANSLSEAFSMLFTATCFTTDLASRLLTLSQLLVFLNCEFSA